MDCSEDVPPTLLASYPKPPATLDVVSLKAYSKEQQLWAVSATNAYVQERAKRRATSDCLADLRRARLIN